VVVDAQREVVVGLEAHRHGTGLRGLVDLLAEGVGDADADGARVRLRDVAGAGIWMRAAGITCAVMSALWLQVICAKSLVAVVPLANVLPLGSVVWLG